MKTKKALKKLDNVEALLSDVMDQFASIEEGVRKLLVSAKASVASAQAKLAAQNKAPAADEAAAPKKTVVKKTAAKKASAQKKSPAPVATRRKAPKKT